MDFQRKYDCEQKLFFPNFDFVMGLLRFRWQPFLMDLLRFGRPSLFCWQRVCVWVEVWQYVPHSLCVCLQIPCRCICIVLVCLCMKTSKLSYLLYDDTFGLETWLKQAKKKIIYTNHWYCLCAYKINVWNTHFSLCRVRQIQQIYWRDKKRSVLLPSVDYFTKSLTAYLCGLQLFAMVKRTVNFL